MRMAKASSIYTRIYTDMGGVDFSGEPSAIERTSFAYLENMYRDYDCGDGLGVETIPGYRPLCRFPGAVRAIHPHPRVSDSFLVHAGSHLYAVESEKRDNLPTPTPLKMRGEGDGLSAEGISSSAILESRLFLADGHRLHIFDGESLSAAEEEAYVPLLYVDGEAHMQKNLLSGRVREEYHLFDLSAYPYTSDGLEYEISPEGVCSILRYTGTAETVVLPARITLGAREYAVSGVATDAFRGNTTVKTLVVSEGIRLLGMRAFFDMRALTLCALPSTIEKIPIQCFDSSAQLKTLYLPREVKEIASYAFANLRVTELHYSGTAEELFSTTGFQQLYPTPLPEDLHVYYRSVYPTVYCRYPLHAPAAGLLSVSLDGETLVGNEPGIRFHAVMGEGDCGETVEAVYLEATNAELLYAKTLSLTYLAHDTFAAEIAAERPGCTLTAAEAINGCTLIARYDGRLFLSGNPALPGTVFYSGRDEDGRSQPTYFGIYDHLTDGDGRTPVRALLSTPTYLLVLTDDAPGHPSLHCHEGMDVESGIVSRLYPVTEGIGGIGCVGAAASFLGDTVFLSRHGLKAVERASLSEERGVVHRSGAVDRRLRRERLEQAFLFRFGSYLGIATEGRVYLADGRRFVTRGGHREYEWYYLSGIGSYEGDRERYRLATGALPPELAEARIPYKGESLALVTVGEAAYADDLPLYSAAENGIPFTYAIKDGRAILCTSDGERIGGVFSPACAFFECEGLLFFGTGDGTLSVFNTDKREEDGRIARRYYSFAGHAYPSGCATKSDDCDLPNLRKSTVRSGGAVKLKAMTGSKVEVRVRTEEGVWEVVDCLYGGRADFGETDFASAELSAATAAPHPLWEAKRRWVEKQLYFVSEEYQRPFGLITVAYRYRVTGRITS